MLKLGICEREVLMEKDNWRLILLSCFAGCLAIFVLWGWALVTIGR